MQESGKGAMLRVLNVGWTGFGPHPTGNAASCQVTAGQDGRGASSLEGLPGDQSQVWGQACAPCSLGTHRKLGLCRIAQETHLGGLSEGPRCDSPRASSSPGPQGHAPHAPDPLGMLTF